MKPPKPKRYAVSTVIKAQKRTLDLVDRVMSGLSQDMRLTLRVDPPGGTITFDEMLNHVRQARDLKVKR